MDKKVSIITINYNGAHDTCELIDSLKKHENYPHEIIVVDNGSVDPKGYISIKENYPDIKVIRSDKNLGFAGGNNLGIKHATGDYLFFLNNDTMITSPTLAYLVDRLESSPEIGCVSPKIACWPKLQIIQYAGFTPMSYITLRNECIGYKQFDRGQFDEAHETSFAHGAAMMIRTKDIQKYGLMPEFYFLYYEELDWCEQIHKAGFSIWYEPKSTIYHKESVSVGTQSPLQVYYHARNRYIFAKRIIPHKQERVCSYLYQTFIAFPKRFFDYLFHHKYHLIAPLYKGFITGLIAIIKDTNYGKVLSIR